MQVVEPGQVADLAAPFSRTDEAEGPLPAMKFAPRRLTAKLAATPATTLDGAISSIAGELITATFAEADFVGSALLAAITEIAFGDGPATGAE